MVYNYKSIGSSNRGVLTSEKGVQTSETGLQREEALSNAAEHAIGCQMTLFGNVVSTLELKSSNL